MKKILLLFLVAINTISLQARLPIKRNPVIVALEKYADLFFQKISKFSHCIRGSANCSQQEISQARAGLVGTGAVLIGFLVGGSFYVAKRRAQKGDEEEVPQVPTQEGKKEEVPVSSVAQQKPKITEKFKEKTGEKIQAMIDVLNELQGTFKEGDLEKQQKLKKLKKEFDDIVNHYVAQPAVYFPGMTSEQAKEYLMKEWKNVELVGTGYQGKEKDVAELLANIDFLCIGCVMDDPEYLKEMQQKKEAELQLTSPVQQATESKQIGGKKGKEYREAMQQFRKE